MKKTEASLSDYKRKFKNSSNQCLVYNFNTHNNNSLLLSNLNSNNSNNNSNFTSLNFNSVNNPPKNTKNRNHLVKSSLGLSNMSHNITDFSKPKNKNAYLNNHSKNGVSVDLAIDEGKTKIINLKYIVSA